MASKKKQSSGSKRPARKTTAAKSSRTTTAKKKPTRAGSHSSKAKPKRDPLAPRTVTTGKGPSPAEIGASLVDMFNRGLLHEIEAKWWSPGIVSIEGMGQAWDGRAAVDGKNQWWAQTNRMVAGSAEGPFVGATGFAVKFHLEVEEIATGRRSIMDEVGVYTVKDGKIVQEEFMYGAPPAASA